MVFNIMWRNVSSPLLDKVYLPPVMLMARTSVLGIKLILRYRPCTITQFVLRIIYPRTIMSNNTKCKGTFNQLAVFHHGDDQVMNNINPFDCGWNLKNNDNNSEVLVNTKQLNLHDHVKFQTYSHIF